MIHCISVNYVKLSLLSTAGNIWLKSCLFYLWPWSQFLASELRILHWARSQTTKMISLGVQRSHSFILLSVSDRPVSCVVVCMCTRVYVCVCTRMHAKEVMQRKGDSEQQPVEHRLQTWLLWGYQTDSDSLIKWMIFLKAYYVLMLSLSYLLFMSLFSSMLTKK